MGPGTIGILSREIPSSSGNNRLASPCSLFCLGPILELLLPLRNSYTSKGTEHIGFHCSPLQLGLCNTQNEAYPFTEKEQMPLLSYKRCQKYCLLIIETLPLLLIQTQIYAHLLPCTTHGILTDKTNYGIPTQQGVTSTFLGQHNPAGNSRPRKQTHGRRTQSLNQNTYRKCKTD